MTTDQTTTAPVEPDAPQPSSEPPQPNPPPHIWLWRRVVRYVPGLLALVLTGYAALLSSTFLSGLQYIPMAVLIGAFITNTFGLHPALEKGVSTYELWLKAGIVLLGVQVAAGSLGAFWLKALPLAALTVVLGIVSVMLLGRLLRLPWRLSALLAVGTGVCGVSAIIQTAPEIGADDEEIEYAVGAVLVLGAAAIVVYPLVGDLFNLSQNVYGMWTGLSVNNTAEAVAAGYSYGPGAGRIAIATKLCRVVMLGAAVSLIRAWARPAGAPHAPTTVSRLWTRFPKFVLIFFLFSLLASAGAISAADQASLRNLSSWLFLIAFAGIGFKLQWQDIRSVGARPIVAIGLGSLLLGGVTLIASTALSEMMFR